MSNKLMLENSAFVLLAGNTKLSLVPGLTAAGASPELTFMTPAVDSEILLNGRSITMREPPMTPDGIPTPAIVTRGCLQLADIPVIVVNAGMAVKPNVPFIETGLNSAEDPRFTIAAPFFDMAVNTGYYIGSSILRRFDSVFLAESVPGGTTTALLTLRSLGFDLKTSTTFRVNPDELKEQIVKDTLGMRLLSPASFLDSVKFYGDYMMALSLGISAALKDHWIYFSGGTQMATVYYLDKMISGSNSRRSVITTRWIMEDQRKTMKTLCGNNLIEADLDFHSSKEDGLRKFEEGHVKEGVGMGAAYLIAKENSSEEMVMKSVEETYERLS